MATAVLTAGAVLALAPGAFGDDAAIDPTDYNVQTDKFVNYTDPAALQAQQNGKQVIVSPYGTSRTIACKGNGADIPFYDCLQHDDFGWQTLQKQDVPQIGTAWVHIV
ncbi:hypothetical protein BJY24_003255 [Nocardia transvalensis]|uniref:Secreted protein n=1 Tax=Nocardia transvalensis TaxID=37333 RepID=A0A7W9UIG6_9NOCA|nr:hypothetical protein [Nocardia transvalensis]MBB5914388.1 hypothetical protein [Nocardia transvalensis]